MTNKSKKVKEDWKKVTGERKKRFDLLVDVGYMIETILGYMDMEEYPKAKKHLESLNKYLFSRLKTNEQK